jgi:hypothetical protein
MASRRSPPRRLLIPTVLAAILAAEITGLAIARNLVPGSDAAPAPAAVAGAVSTAPAGAASAAGAADAVELARLANSAAVASGTIARNLATTRVQRPAERVRAAIATKPKTSSTGGSGHGSSSPAPTSYQGRNHVWIPSLGINKAVQSFPCSRNRPPDAGVYRWGCAGRNNVYLMGHAWSTFKPLHDAYVGGRLHSGMKVIYGDGAGRVHTYSVIWWKVVKPTTAASWAWASLSRPSMTLQTCVGANSAYRLMVRLVEVG